MSQLGQEEPIGYSRLILTTILIAVVFILWAAFFTPDRSPEVPAQQQKENPKEAPPAVVDEKKPDLPVMDFSKSVAGEKEETLKLENEDLILHFSSKGAVLTHAFVKKFREKGALEPDDLVSPLSGATGTYPLAIVSGDEPLDEALGNGLFHMEQSAQNLIFKWSDGKGNSARKTFSLEDKGYLLKYDLSLVKNSKPVSAIPIAWGIGLGKLSKEQAKNKYFQQEYIGYETAGSFKKGTRARKPVEPYSEEIFGAGGLIKWAGVANNYFTAIFLPEEPVKAFKIRTYPIGEDLRKLHPSDSDLALIIETKGKGKIYLGPKDYSILKKFDGQVFRMMNWGWSWFAAICAFLLWALKELYRFFSNYGLAILVLTFIIKLIFYPFTQSSMVKMKEMGEAMKKLKPQIDKIRAKYKKAGLDMQSRGKMNEETMALYKKEGVNPLGNMSGCLPMLLQLPIFWALFTMLPNTIDLRGAHFFWWIKDLSLADPYYITPILMGVSMLISTMMTSTQSVEPAQKIMLYFMPVIFTWFCLWAPAGLTLYWLTNNLLTMGQQYVINKQVEKKALEAQKSRKSTPKGPSRPS